MDSCVHIWKFETTGGGDKTKLVEYSCGGYMTKVRRGHDIVLPAAYRV